MRVLAVTNLFPSPFDPNRAPFNRQQFRALADLHPLHVIAPVLWTEELAGRRAGIPALPAGRRMTWDDIPVDYPKYWYPPRILRHYYGHCFLASVRRTFRRVVSEFRPDVVLGTWAYPDGWAAVRLAREFGLPVAVKVHGCDVLYGLREHPARFRRTVEGLRQADRVIAVSQDLARGVADFGVPSERIDVVYNGIDTDRFHPGPKHTAREQVGLDDEGPAVVFVGGLVPVKGVDLLLAACDILAKRGVRFRCHLIGGGPQRAELEARAQSLGLAAVVRFHGSKPHQEIPDWFRAADLFVLPSRSEGVPGVLVEAMACGARYVATRVGGVPEVAAFGDGRLVPPGDAERFADAMQEMLARRDPVVATRLGLGSYSDSARALAGHLEALAAAAGRPLVAV
jgi:glycosyltransferase involved in cell wall biosynthesis